MPARWAEQRDPVDTGARERAPDWPGFRDTAPGWCQVAPGWGTHCGRCTCRLPDAKPVQGAPRAWHGAEPSDLRRESKHDSQQPSAGLEQKLGWSRGQELQAAEGLQPASHALLTTKRAGQSKLPGCPPPSGAEPSTNTARHQKQAHSLPCTSQGRRLRTCSSGTQ